MSVETKKKMVPKNNGTTEMAGLVRSGTKRSILQKNGPLMKRSKLV